MQPLSFRTGMIVATIAMVVLVVASNILVQVPISAWFTWGTVTYPFCFLVTDLTNRAYGPAAARRVVYVGFALAVLLSVQAAGWRIALASGSAFLIAQLLDIYVFDRLRRSSIWWQPPLVSSLAGSAVDTAWFFTIAFAGTQVPWVTLGTGDFIAKLLMALFMLAPFRALMPLFWARPAAGVAPR